MKDMTTNSYSQETQYHSILLRISSPNFNIKSDYISGNHEFANCNVVRIRQFIIIFLDFVACSMVRDQITNICVTQISYRILTLRHFFRKGCVKDSIHQIHMITCKNS